MYIQLDDDKRICAAAEDNCLVDGIEVEALPDGEIGDYKYIKNEYVFEPVVTQADKVESQVLYTAMLTDTLIEEI